MKHEIPRWRMLEHARTKLCSLACDAVENPVALAAKLREQGHGHWFDLVFAHPRPEWSARVHILADYIQEHAASAEVAFGGEILAEVAMSGFDLERECLAAQFGPV